MTWFDTTLMRWVVANRFPLGDQLAHGIMFLGTNLVILTVAALLGLVYVVARHRYQLAVQVAIAVVASTLIAELLKQMLGRARPPVSMALVHANGLSMPSTDAALTAAAATALSVGLLWLHPRLRRLVGVILAAGVIAVGLCLIYLGVHWPTDVFAGWALGIGVGAGTAAMMTPRRWRRDRQLHHLDHIEDQLDSGDIGPGDSGQRLFTRLHRNARPNQLTCAHTAEGMGCTTTDPASTHATSGDRGLLGAGSGTAGR